MFNREGLRAILNGACQYKAGLPCKGDCQSCQIDALIAAGVTLVKEVSNGSPHKEADYTRPASNSTE